MKIRHICFSVIFVLIIYVISFAGKCAYSALPIGTGVHNSGKLRIFVTAAASEGNLVGASGADNRCNLDANKPSTGYYRALILDASRNSTTHPNWALKPQTSYYRSTDMALIGTTDLNARITTLINVISTSGVYAWTGMNAIWALTSSSCTDWTINAPSPAVGMVSMTNDGSFPSNSSSQPCSISYYLICVEQP